MHTWGKVEEWETAQYRLLGEMIYNASGLRLNLTTLKRLFQKKNQPQMATCNALCAFLGYGNYANYIIQKSGLQNAIPNNGEDTGIEPELPQPEHQEEENPLPEPEKEEEKEDIKEREEQKNKDLETESARQEKKEPQAAPAATDQQPAPHPGTKPVPKNAPHASRKRLRRKLLLYPSLVMAVGIALLLAAHYSDTFRQKREKHLIDRVVFQTSCVKGVSPFTTRITYDIPSKLLDDISLVCIESNGDAVTREIPQPEGEMHITFIYPGQSLCKLMYKNQVIRTLTIESRTPGWSTFLKEERNDLYLSFPFDKVDTADGYLTLPSREIPPQAISDQMFVSYTYYTDSIISGDNFIFEAEVRNSATIDHGIACYDIMLYAFGDTGIHGFALNKDCYSYLKFVSGERSVSGIQQDLSHLNFDPDVWHVMKIETIDRRTRFYLDNKIILHMDYKNPVGAINELTLRFKGCGAVKYVKVTDPKTGKQVFLKRFDEK